MDSRPPILVTGAHRSGTTWVGKMLAAGGQAAYISEPLNLWHRPGVLRVAVQHWYTYLCDENEGAYLPALRELLAFRYHWGAEMRALRSPRDVLRMGRDAWIFLNGRLRRRRPLLKDPFAVFSAPWFARRLGCQVVITVRHPAGFASSLKRLQWPFDLRHLLDQPLLMRDHLEPFRADLERLAPDDLLAQAALLWRMIYHVVDGYCTQHPDFRLVRHEDLSLDPVAGYRQLYADLGLDFTPRVEAAILRSSASENPREVSRANIYAVRLNSRANLDNWKKRLSAEEIARIRKLTADIAPRYYPDSDW